MTHHFRIRFLLLVALLATVKIGCEEPASPPAIPASKYAAPESPAPYAQRIESVVPGVALTDITSAAGIEFTHRTGAFGSKWMPETMGGGGAFFDYDNDHRPDLLLINSNYWPGHAPKNAEIPTNKLYRNLGDGTFEDVTATAGLSELSSYAMGVAIADYDGDGDRDIFLTAVGKNHLLQNDAGRFRDVTDTAGVGFSRCDGKASPWEWSAGAAWLDHDRDGDLDLFVTNYVQWTPQTDLWTTADGKTKTYATPQQYRGATCVLFRNNGDATFTDVTKQAGVYNPDGKSLSVVTDDFNDDGWTDLVVTNDTQPNFLYINNTDGTFTNRALSAGVAYDENGLARAGMGVDVADLTNKGPRAIAIGNFAGEPVSLYTQAGPHAFIDRAGAAKLTKPTNTVLTFGLRFADLNLDGFDDLLLANGHIEPDIARIREGWTFAQSPQLFLNDGQGRFVDHTKQASAIALAPMVGRGLATADIDGDGDLDVLIAANGASPRLLRNDHLGQSRVVRIRLIGNAPNLDAIGARLRAQVRGSVISRFMTTGGSYLSQSEPTVTIGLADAGIIDRLDVRWPDGTTQHLESLAADPVHPITYVVTQGETTLRTERSRSTQHDRP